jgi:hypothetical protein
MHSTEILPNLPASIVRHALDTMLAILPRPVPDTPENRARRDELAVAALIALRPSDAFEVTVAVQIVAGNAHAADSLRLAIQPGIDDKLARRLRNVAAGMMDLLRGEAQMLRRRQAARQKTAGAAPRPAPAGPKPAADPAAEAKRLRAERIRELGLRLLDPPATRH